MIDPGHDGNLRSASRFWLNCSVMSQTTLQNLNTPQGRAAYRRYWHDLIIDQRNVLLPSLVRLWQTATTGRTFELASTGEGFQIVHPLGIRAGTRLFMEEVIVRHYFNNIQALVYLGAVLLLTSLGLRFAGLLSERIALIGIGIEVIMLLMLFMVLFYTPDESILADDPADDQRGGSERSEESTHATIREVLEEIEEIGGTYAALGMRVERLAQAQSEQIEALTGHVAQISGLQELANHSDGLAKMNDRLDRLVDSIDRLNHRIEILTGKEIEYRVRQELERRISPAVAPELDSGTGREQSPS